MIRNRTPGYAKRVIPKKRNRFLTPHGDVLKIHRNGGCSEWKGDIKKKKRAWTRESWYMSCQSVVYSKTTCMVLGIARSKPCSLRLRLWSKKRRGSEMNRRDRTSLWSDWLKGFFSTRTSHIWWQEYGFRHVFPTNSESQTQYHHVSLYHTR